MTQNEKCSFSISLNEEKSIKYMRIGNGHGSKVLIEGDIGIIDNVKVVDDVLLKINGTNGMMSISLPENILEKMGVKREKVR